MVLLQKGAGGHQKNDQQHRQQEKNVHQQGRNRGPQNEKTGAQQRKGQRGQQVAHAHGLIKQGDTFSGEHILRAALAQKLRCALHIFWKRILIRQRMTSRKHFPVSLFVMQAMSIITWL